MLVEYEVEPKACSGSGVTITFEYLMTTYTEIVEVPAYPWSKFITDIGGWLSLFSGMSALSLLEIFIFIPLATVHLWRKMRNVGRRYTIN